VGGFMNVFYNGPLSALLQATVRPEMQGRVFTVLQSLVWIAWPSLARWPTWLVCARGTWRAGWWPCWRGCLPCLGPRL